MRSAKGLVLAAVAVFGAIAFAVLPIRVWECPQCRGVAERVRKMPPSGNPAETGCPACEDGGKVSFWTARFRRRADPLLCRMIQNPSALDESRDTFVETLNLLLLRNKVPAAAQRLNRGHARFATDRGVPVVVAILNQANWTIPGTSEAACWLFDFAGNLLDHARASCSTREGSLFAVFEKPGAADDAVVRFDADAGQAPREEFEKFTLEHGGPPRTYARQDRSWPREWLTKGLCRLSVANGRFKEQ